MRCSSGFSRSAIAEFGEPAFWCIRAIKRDIRGGTNKGSKNTINSRSPAPYTLRNCNGDCQNWCLCIVFSRGMRRSKWRKFSTKIFWHLKWHVLKIESSENYNFSLKTNLYLHLTLSYVVCWTANWISSLFNM